MHGQQSRDALHHHRCARRGWFCRPARFSLVARCDARSESLPQRAKRSAGRNARNTFLSARDLANPLRTRPRLARPASAKHNPDAPFCCASLFCVRPTLASESSRPPDACAFRPAPRRVSPEGAKTKGDKLLVARPHLPVVHHEFEFGFTQVLSDRFASVPFAMEALKAFRNCAAKIFRMGELLPYPWTCSPWRWLW